MSIVDTALVFAGIPLGVVALITLAVYWRTDLNYGVRYRPGKPWEHAPVWYIPHVESGHGEALAIESGHSHSPAEAVGGASGEW